MGYACFLIVFCRILRAYSAIPRPARVWPSPPSPIRSRRLALAHAGRAAQRIDVPEFDSGAEILHTDFPGHFRSRFAAPNDAELRLGSLVKNIDHVAGLQLRVHALQRCAAAADGAQAGGLSERAGIRVHAPDLNRKIHENTRLAAPIHAFSFGGRCCMVGGTDRQTKVTAVTNAGVSKVWLRLWEIGGSQFSRHREASRRRGREDRRRIRKRRAQPKVRTTLGRHRENAKLRRQFLALALGAFGFVAAKNEGFKLVLTFLADIFKNRHDVTLLRRAGPIKIEMWGLRKPGRRGPYPQLPSRLRGQNTCLPYFVRIVFYVAGTGKRWRHSSFRGKLPCLQPKSA